MASPFKNAAEKATVQQAIIEKHAHHLGLERLTIDALSDGDHVSASVTLASPDRTFVYTMESAIQRTKYKAMTVAQARTLCFDFLDWYLGEFFATNRDTLLPIDWQPHRFGDVEVMARGEIRNAFLDDAADAWLRGERPDVDGEWKRMRRKH